MLAGLPVDRIELALRIDRKVADLPRLREVFRKARAPLNCLRVVLGVATPERDAMLALAVVSQTKAELEVQARKIRTEEEGRVQPPPAGEAHQPTLGFDPAATNRPGTPPPERPRTPGTECDVTSEIERPGTTVDCAVRTTGPAPAAHEPSHPVGTGHVQITIRAVVHERLQRQQTRLSAIRGRPVSMDEVLLALLEGDTTRSKYLPVIRTSVGGEPVSLRTGTGVRRPKPTCPPLRVGPGPCA